MKQLSARKQREQERSRARLLAFQEKKAAAAQQQQKQPQAKETDAGAAPTKAKGGEDAAVASDEADSEHMEEVEQHGLPAATDATMGPPPPRLPIPAGQRACRTASSTISRAGAKEKKAEDQG